LQIVIELASDVLRLDTNDSHRSLVLQPSASNPLPSIVNKEKVEVAA
jgi:hypothetical protein